MRNSAKVLCAALLAALVLGLEPSPAHAGWGSTGNPVADTTSRAEIPTAVCTDQAGGFMVAYTFASGDSLAINRVAAATGGKLWGSQGVRINAPGNASTTCLAVSDSAGGAWTVWNDSRSTAPGLYVQRFNASGAAQLTSGGLRILNRQPQNVGVNATASGKLLIAYLNPGDSVMVERLSVNGAKDFAGDGVLAALNGDALSLRVLVVPDGEGGIASYGRFIVPTGGSSSTEQLWANRFSSTGAMQWGVNGINVLGIVGVNAIAQQMFWDGTNLFLAWQHGPAFFNFAEQYPIHAQKLNGSGVKQWTANGVLVFTPVTGSPFFLNLNDEMQLVDDHAGGCLFAWLDGRNYNQPSPPSGAFLHGQDIYGQRLNASGTPQWTANGAPVDSGAGSVETLTACTDGADGMLIGDTDFTFGDGDEDVRLWHVNGSGVVQWNQFLNSLAFAEPPSRDRNPVLQPDGLGGAFVAWEDGRDPTTTNSDVYATHRTASGAPLSPQITVVQPNGGERFSSVESMDIKWTSNYLGKVRLQISPSPGVRQLVFGLAVPNTGDFLWSGMDGISSSTCRILISDFDTGTPIDSSNAFFSACDALSNGLQVNLGASERDGLAADFNEDGILDIAATTPTGVTVQLGLGSGGVWNGSFGAPASFALADARRFVSADLNDDGHLDLAVTTGAGVSLLRGLGTGSFAAAQTIFPSTRDPQGIAVGDLDQNGILDLAVCLRDTDEVQVLYGHGSGGIGDGTFASGPRFRTIGRAERVAIVDMTGEGVQDIIATNESTFGLTFIAGIPSPGAPYTLGAFTSSGNSGSADSCLALAIGDFNEDGVPDVALGQTGGVGHTGVMLQAKSGSFGFGSFFSPTIYGGGFGQCLAVMDLNGDGRADIAAPTALGISALLGNGTGALGDGTFTTSANNELGVISPVEAFVADFNQDGISDLLLISGSTASNQSKVILGGCSCQVPNSLTITAPAPASEVFAGLEDSLSWTRGAGSGLAHIDLSRDGGAHWKPLYRYHGLPAGIAKFVAGLPNSDQALLRVTDAMYPGRLDVMDGTFRICSGLAFNASYPHADELDDVHVADMNGDGKLDLIVAGPQTRVLAGNGDGTFGPPIATTTPLAGTQVKAAFADFNRDGLMDVAGGFGTHFTIYLAEKNGSGQWTGNWNQAEDIAAPAFGMYAGDFDEDGILDLAVLGQNSSIPDTVYVYHGLGANGVGDGTFAQPPDRYPVGNLAGDLAIADVNGDGILDLIVGSRGLSSNPPFGLSVLLGQGSGGRGNGSFAPAIQRFPSLSISTLAVGDFDEDGILDLMVGGGHFVSDSVIFLRGLSTNGTTGNGLFQETTGWRVPDGPHDIKLADFNEDGQLDMAVACSTADSIVVLMRRGSSFIGSGAFFRHQTFAAAGAPTALALEDFNGDDRVDLVSVQRTGQDARVFLGACGTGVLAAPVLNEGGSTPQSQLRTRPAPDHAATTGQGLQIGSEHAISWTGGAVKRVGLDVSRDGGSTWVPIADNLFGSSFEWTVTPPATQDAKLRVRDASLAARASVSTTPTVIDLFINAANDPLPRTASFSRGWPNPARGAVQFTLALPGDTRLRVEVYDVGGRLVRMLADQVFEPGEHRLSWDGRDQEGRSVGAGVFFVRARGPGLDRRQSIVRVQ